MRFATLPTAPARSGLPDRVSVLGFGCAPLMGRVGRKASLAALHAALEGGINFFDTARSYGYGESEALLGEFLAGRREQVVLCTKFGILPAKRGGWKRRLKPVAQAAVRLAPGLRRAAQRGAAGQLVPGQFSLANLRASVETSLRALRTEYVDMLLLHDADPEVLRHGELLDAMGELVRAGKVRMAGVSGPHATAEAMLEQRPAGLTTAQFAMNPASFGFLRILEPLRAAGVFLVANHPFGGADGVDALKTRVAQLQREGSLPTELREKLAVDPGDLLPEVVFSCILQGTGISSVVAAMMSPAHLQRNLRAVERPRFSAAEAETLRRLLTAAPAGSAAGSA